MPLPSGTRMGPYQVTSQIGSGGMGEVYRARREFTDFRVPRRDRRRRDPRHCRHMAPEQARGGVADTPADIWAFGVREFQE